MESLNFKTSIIINKKNLVIDSLEMLDSSYVRIVEKKQGWFKPSSIEIQTLNTNPFIKNTNQASLIYQPKRKNRIVERILLVGAGLTIGLFPGF